MPNIYDIAGNLQQPNVIGNIQAGQQFAQAQQARQMQLAQAQQQQADQAQLRNLAPGVISGDPNAYAQAAAINPQAAQQYQSAGDDQIRRLQGAMAFIDQQATPQAKEAAYQQVKPYLARFGTPPDTFAEAEPKMEAARAQIAMLGQQGGDQYISVPAQGAVFNKATGKVEYQNPGVQKTPETIATLEYLSQHPDLAAFQRRQQASLHPTVAGGARAPMGYRFTASGDLEAIPGGPADRSSQMAAGNLSDDAMNNAAWKTILTGDSGIRGYSKEAVAQRAQIMNKVADIAKQAGVSPQELSTTAGRNKALQSSLTNLQKQSDVMQKSEQGFQNNLDQALQLSDELDRTGSPVLNKWLLGGRAALGDPKVAAFDAAINAASVDYARIMSGQTGAGGTPISTAEEAKQLLRKELSNQSLQAVAEVLHKDIMGQQSAVDQQRQTILGAMQAFGHSSPEYKNDKSQEAPPGTAANAQKDYSNLWGG